MAVGGIISSLRQRFALIRDLECHTSLIGRGGGGGDGRGNSGGGGVGAQCPVSVTNYTLGRWNNDIICKRIT